MKKGLIVACLTAALFVLTSIAGADVRGLLEDRTRQKAVKTAATGRSMASIDARSYRSPGALRKVVARSDDRDSLSDAASAGAIEVSDYGSFKLFLIDQAALDRIGAQSRIAVRDDFNVLLLRSGVIDTTAGEGAGTLVGMGRNVRLDAAQKGGLPHVEKLGGARLRLVQFAGPVRREWLDRLRDSGLEVIAYVPNNAYLVRGDEGASGQMLRAARIAYDRGEGFLQWEGPFLDEYKIHPALAPRMKEPEGEVTVAVQVARSARYFDGAADADVEMTKRLASGTIIDSYEVLGFTNLKLRLEAGRIGEIAALANVVNIEPWSPPRLLDERAAQIVAGDLTGDGKQARGPGYQNWLAARGLASRFGFAIDVTDTGIDRGSTEADKLHPDFLDSTGQSRVLYARDYTRELDAGDPPGHGTINLSIAGGSSASADSAARDSAGFMHGLGVAPFALLGSSRIFQASGKFDLSEPYTSLISAAYRDGARVSSNSWGEVRNEYSLDAQEYDARVRDAMPAAEGRQEMVICFAAGNAGPNEAISSPGTAKNVLSIGASENFRSGGEDGCGVEDADADNAQDMAFFSSGGPLFDGRLKPDIVAPGSHIQGAASQHPEYDGTGVCGEDIDKPYFPAGQTLYTWSSGTSHSTPVVAGAAALARQFFLNRGEEPSAALIKALLTNTATYMTGAGAGGNLPHPNQGWGLLNIGRAFDGASKIFVNQSHTFTDSGQEFVITGEIKDSSLPFRVTLCWSDAPGFTAVAPWVNNLDLEVVVGGRVYTGNSFTGQQSEPGGEPNTKDNVEGVWLPAGTTGVFAIRVRAQNIAGDGVPGNADAADQDFALVVYNGERKDVAVPTLEKITVTGGPDSVADPGETVSMRVSIKNVSPVAFTGGRGLLAAGTGGVTVTKGATDFPEIAQGTVGDALTEFEFAIDRTVQCGSTIDFVLEVSSGGSFSRVPVSLRTGNIDAIELFSDDIESGEAKWTHGSLVKKKKNRKDTWVISSKRFNSGASAWFTPNPGKAIDSNLDTVSIQLPPDGRNLRLTFFHTFEFEPGRFDGGVLEISTGGDFEDLGPKIIRGQYNGTLRQTGSNALSGRAGWVDGRFGPLQPVIVDLSSFAGRTVKIRFRIGADQNVKGLGWFIDDVRVAGDRVSCAP
jgi:hypothetical protein